MKVSISVKGRFHAFYLAAELQRHGELEQLLTSYPKFETKKYGIKGAHITSLPMTEVMHRAWDKLPSALRRGRNLQLYLSEHYERRAARHLRPGADLFVGWSGVSLAAIRRAKSMGMRTVVERCSTHIVHQRDVLCREYEHCGLPARLPDPGIVEKELEEYACADAIAIPSEYVKRTFLDAGIAPEKLIHVPYGVALDAFEPVPKSDSAFRLIQVGSVQLRKGCSYLLRAFRELNLPNAELWFVGSVHPEMRPFIERWSSPGVKFLGSKPQPELKNYYGQSSVFCLASIEEGMAFVIPQAMACGLPVLATRNTGAEDIVRDGKDGHLVEARNLAALKEKIVWFYENQDAARAMGASARARVSNSYTWSEYGTRIRSAYTRVLQRTSQSPCQESPRDVSFQRRSA